jgi:hypothetical protein
MSSLSQLISKLEDKSLKSRLTGLSNRDLLVEINKVLYSKSENPSPKKSSPKKSSPKKFLGNQTKSKIWRIDENVEVPQIKENIGENENDVKILEKLARKELDFSKLNRGDIVHFISLGDYRNQGKVIFDGKHFVILDDGTDEYGNLPRQFHVQEFPTPDYFSEAIDHNSIIWLKTTGKPLTLVSSKNGIYKYLTSDGYTIYHTDKNLQNKYEKEEEIMMYYSLDAFLDMAEDKGAIFDKSMMSGDAEGKTVYENSLGYD